MSQGYSPYPPSYKFPHADHGGGTIAFQGKPGAYSQLACQTCYPLYRAIPFDDFDSVFAAVAAGQCDLAMIPIQNSLGGRVADIHQLLPTTHLFIIAEHFQPIHHCWLAARGVDRRAITLVYSHPQALMQSRKFIAAQKLTAVEFADTAGAAHYVAQQAGQTARGGGPISAIASAICADIYGLEILQKNVESATNNITRFIILAKAEHTPKPEGKEQVVTSMVFSLKSIPAALYKCLGGFASNSINLLKLESYIPLLASEQTAQFYIEFLGAPNDDGVQNALEELAHFTKSTRLLGSYIKNQPR